MAAGAVGTGAPFLKDSLRSICHISRAALLKDKRQSLCGTVETVETVESQAGDGQLLPTTEAAVEKWAG